MRLDAADRWLLLQAVGWLALARLALTLVSFRRLCAWLSRRPARLHQAADPALVHKAGWAVTAAARRVPWRADCFPQAIAAQQLLRQRGQGSTLHIGVVNAADRGLSGHAWLTCGGVVVTGGGGLDRFAVLHTFCSEEPGA